MSESAAILVIDDLDTNLFMLSTLLKREGFTVLTAASGPEGRTIAREERPDLILLDIMMPGENGFQTCELLKRDRSTASIPIVFLSALEDTESKVRGLHLGAVDFVSKPFMREEILARLRAQLRRVRLEPLLVRVHVDAVREAGLSGSGEDPAADASAMASTVVFGMPAAAAPFGADNPVFIASADVAAGISGIFFAAPSCAAFSAQKIGPALRSLLALNASVLNTPENTLRLINAEFCALFPGSGAVSAGYCLVNRNASRLSIASGGRLRAFIADSIDVMESVEIEGDALGMDTEAAFAHADRTMKPGMRIVLFLGGTAAEALDEAGAFPFRSAVSSTLSLSVRDQAESLNFAFGASRSGGAGGVLVFSS